MGIFKAYDIRGIYNKDWNKDIAYKIGYFLPELLKTNKILVGRDVRVSSDEIFEYLVQGIIDASADVYDAGLTTTPMIYFGTSFFNFEGSVMITASHNPPEYNGLKISKKNSLPVGYESGLKELERLIKENKIIPSSKKGSIKKIDIKSEYIKFMKNNLNDLSNLKIGIDCSNGMASIIIKDILVDYEDNIKYIFDKPDGRFPNHEPNPLIPENQKFLKELVKNFNLDIGVIFDGDADRVMFIDENGNFISPDLIIAVIAEHYLKKEKGYVIYDIRTSWSVKEFIEMNGGKPYMWKVGHAYAKVKLRELNGICGGELAGHYYFRDFYYCDSGILASLIVLNQVSKLKREGKTISQLINTIKKYYSSGEINFKINDKSGAMREVKKYFEDNEKVINFYDFDGFRLEFNNWWFNIRPSNTEPYLRLVCEAKSSELLEEKVNIIKNILKNFE